MQLEHKTLGLVWDSEDSMIRNHDNSAEVLRVKDLSEVQEYFKTWSTAYYKVCDGEIPVKKVETRLESFWSPEEIEGMPRREKALAYVSAVYFRKRNFSEVVS